MSPLLAPPVRATPASPPRPAPPALRPEAPALLVTATGMHRVRLAPLGLVSPLARLARPLAEALGLPAAAGLDVDLAFDAPSVHPGPRRLTGYTVDALDPRVHIVDPWATAGVHTPGGPAPRGVTAADVAVFDGRGREVAPAPDAIALTQTLALTWEPRGTGTARETVIFYGPVLVVAYEAGARGGDVAGGLTPEELAAFERGTAGEALPELADCPWGVDLASEARRLETARARRTLDAARERARQAPADSPLGRAQAALLAAFAAADAEAATAGALPAGREVACA